MKKIALLAALTVLPVFSAQAIPTMVMTLTQANATAGECTTLGGVYGGGSCSFTDTDGQIDVDGVYGDYLLNQELGTGFPIQAQPALWLNSTNATLLASTITITLAAYDYSFPAGSFPLLSTASGTVNEDMSVSLNSYYDADNTGIAGNGVLLLDADWVGFASGAVPSNSTAVTNGGDGLYSVSWVLNVTRTEAGNEPRIAAINGTLTQDQSPTGVPSPTGMALLGLGLIGLGAMRRRAD